MKASEFDQRFDACEDITPLLDLSQARRPGMDSKRINIAFPAWMVQSMDKEAHKLWVIRQSLIRLWMADKLEHSKQLLR